MSIDDMIDELDEILEASWTLPLTGGRAVVSTEKIKVALDNIRLALPNEIKQAQAIVNDRSQIIKDAKQESETIIRVAEERAKKMTDQNEITKQAELRSKEILSETQNQVNEMKKAASDYVEDIMQKTEDVLSQSLMDVKNTKKGIKSSVR